MCHFLYCASPLTLSEVRSMLPAGLVADSLPPGPGRQLLALISGGQTAARLLVGSCACDFFLQRDPRHHREESELRHRYRALGLTRAEMIAALDRHREGSHLDRSPEEWQAVLAAFVAEHLRNAGRSLYYHEFAAQPFAMLPFDGREPPEPVATTTIAAVRSDPGTWLDEGRPTLVLRS